MRLTDGLRKRERRAGRLLGALLVSALPGLLLFSAHAQETPVDATDDSGTAEDTVLRIEIGGSPEPIPEEAEFDVQVLLDNVEHLAAFEFTIGFDPGRMSYERVENQGQFLTTSQRGANMFCPDPVAEEGSVLVVCSTLGPPVCLGGEPGASGSGLLATGIFMSKGGGTATVDLRDATLILDDVSPCDPDTGATQDIAHRVEGASVDLTGGDGGVSWLPAAPIAGVVVLVLVGVYAGLLRRRRRRAAP